MAISFVREQKKHRYLLAIFAVVILITGVIVYQNFFRGKNNVVPVASKEPISSKVEINFRALENPILTQLQPFDEITLTPEVENLAGRKNPFLPY
jgi:hypothetical protein